MGILNIIFKPMEMSTGTSVPHHIVKIVNTVKIKPDDQSISREMHGQMCTRRATERMVRVPQTGFGLQDDSVDTRNEYVSHHGYLQIYIRVSGI
jgi:hypothetical protein